MKLTRISAAVVAAALAPAVFFSSPAFAADGVTETTSSVPDNAAEVKPEEGAGKKQAEEDKAAILKILGEGNIGRGLKREAEKALNGTPEEMRAFLTTGQYKARDEDNRIAILRILGLGKDVGPGVTEAANKALNGTPEDRVKFLESGYKAARTADDRVRTVQILSVGGPAVREAAKKALKGTPEDVRHFLEVGQFEARAKDEAAEKAAKEAKEKEQKEKEGKDGAGSDKGGKDDKPSTGDRAKPENGGGSGAKSTADIAGKPVAKDTDQGGQMAATGADAALPWAVGGSALALAAGAGMVLAARRRRAAN